VTAAHAAAEPEVEEQVVLLDDGGHVLGTADKATVHHGDTPLHLAFSAYLVDPLDRLLVTRRALSKKTFPGLRTNSVCGHPAPGEGLDDAVRRRARRELGLEVGEVRLVLPGFRYRAVMDGVVENEICPVVLCPVDAVRPDPAADEVDEASWGPWDPFVAGVLDGSLAVSPWCRLQVAALAGLGGSPRSWPAGDVGLLPPALRGSG
jgi:isopentenyl-diphosphate delta-isomerase